MSKVMSILEKYNLVEKVIKEKPEYANLCMENNIELGEVVNGENINLNVESNDCKEEAKVSEVVVKEKFAGFNPNTTFEEKMTIDDIYSLCEIKNSNINTIFMLQKLINALPQNLPKDIVKQSVINIINASNIDLNELISDGEQRIDLLAKVMDEYCNQTNKRIMEYKEEIARLSGLISNCQEQIKAKESLIEEQIYEIKFEAQKIESIIDFFSK